MLSDSSSRRIWSPALSHTIAKPVIAVVMGVSGSGKTTVAVLLAAALGCQFQEGDDLHPAANVEKMRSGTPLTDADRLPWLNKIVEEIDGWRARGESGVLTCSALKRSYRDIIVGGRPDVTLIYLKGSRDLIHRRMAARHEHFMPLALLDSQFATLQEPTPDEHPLTVDVGHRPPEIVAEIVHQLEVREGDTLQANVEVLADPEILARRVAEWIIALANAKRGNFAICLSGGSTPQRFYQHLAQPGYRDRFPWPRAHWFWGDERFVPHDDALSNYRMVREALLSRAPIPPANIHAIPTEGIAPDAAASAYERELKSFYGAERLDPTRSLFDVNLLGLGEDGHTASLFPGSPILAERERWVCAVVGAKPEARITLTYPALDSSTHAAFLVTGTGKRAIFERLRCSDERLPAAGIRPTGTLWLFSDRAANGSEGST
jgi:6-phosphogluconolactonase